MASPRVSNTALGAATCRLIEQYQPEATRLFDDPVVQGMLSQPVPFLMRLAAMRNFTVQQTDGVLAGLYGEQICRTCYIDDAVVAALSQGINQLVILGAGYDTRAYRLLHLGDAAIFEVDLPKVQDDKKQKIQKFLGRLPEHMTYLPIDFDAQRLGDVFAGTAFDHSRPAVFVWEAVTQYISEEAVRQTLDFAGKSAPGSLLAFTYVLKSVIERRSNIPGANKLMDFAARGAPFIFGLEPNGVPAFLAPFGLVVTADVGNASYQETYLKPIQRAMDVSEVERVAQARRSGD